MFKKKKKRIAYLEEIDACSQKVEKFLVDFMKKVIRFHIYGCLKFIDNQKIVAISAMWYDSHCVDVRCLAESLTSLFASPNAPYLHAHCPTFFLMSEYNGSKK